MISALAFHIFIRESKQLNNNKFSPHKFNYRAQFTLWQLGIYNLVPRALFPGFGGGKPGKSALGTRLRIY